MPAVSENAKKIMDQLRQGGNFVAYARQFSEASTASVGGDLGWLSLAQLPQSLANAAANMNANEIRRFLLQAGFRSWYLSTSVRSRHLIRAIWC